MIKVFFLYLLPQAVSNLMTACGGVPSLLATIGFQPTDCNVLTISMLLSGFLFITSIYNNCVSYGGKNKILNRKDTVNLSPPIQQYMVLHSVNSAKICWERFSHKLKATRESAPSCCTFPCGFSYQYIRLIRNIPNRFFPRNPRRTVSFLLY